MKKRILIIATVLMTITVFAIAKWNYPDKRINNSNPSKTPSTLPFFIPQPANLYYDLGTRFTPMKKSDIDKATSLRNFLPDEHNKRITDIASVNLILIENDHHTDIQFFSKGSKLSQEQKEYLQSCDYSTNLKLMSLCKATGGCASYATWQEFSPHITIVPEQPAYYSLGKEEFVEYIRKGNTKNTYNLDSDKIGFAKLKFTVQADGSIANLTLDRSSGYKNIDDTISKLLVEAPGKWIPAVNQEGKKVNQDLVLTFGKGGC